MAIPFIDLKTQYRLLEHKIKQRIDTVLSHGKFILGPEITELEEMLSEFVGVKYAISCSSGTDALYMALVALDTRRGDVVLTSPFTFVATAEVIAQVGAIPVFVDIDPTTFNMDPSHLSRAIQALTLRDRNLYPYPPILDRKNTINIKGIIAVNLFGTAAEYTEINEIAREYGLFVIEDGAQSFGGKYRGRMSCSLADIGCTSFFPAKPLGCYGDGGAVFTNDPSMAQLVTSIRVHGSGEDKYHNIRLGINGRMDTLQAAILIEKLSIFPEEIKKREEVAQRYFSLLSPLDEIKVPHIPSHIKSAWAQYSIVVKEKRDELACYLQEKGIPTAIYYKVPLHLQRAFEYLGYKKGDMGTSEDIAEHILSLPMHPYLKREVQEEIVGHIKNFFAKH